MHQVVFKALLPDEGPASADVRWRDLLGPKFTEEIISGAYADIAEGKHVEVKRGRPRKQKP